MTMRQVFTSIARRNSRHRSRSDRLCRGRDEYQQRVGDRQLASAEKCVAYSELG